MTDKNAEKLQDAIGEVRDDFVQDAALSVPKKKKVWMKWAAAAACLCLAAVGVYAAARPGGRGDAPDGELPRVTVPEYAAGSFGFEGLMYFSPEELENGNPWREDTCPGTMPVYKNGSWDPTGAGVPAGLDVQEMTRRLERAAGALGLELLSVKQETDAEKDKDGTVTPGKNVYGLSAETDRGRLRVLANGTLAYEPPEGWALPEGYSFTYSDTSDAQALEAMEYLVEQYASLLQYSHPQICLGGDYTFEGKYTRNYKVYDSTGDPGQDVLNYFFRSAAFAPDDEGNLMLIYVYDGLAAAEKMGDYPLISAAQAREKLAAGKYQTSVPVPMPGEEYVARTELVYRPGPGEETLLPYYRFWVELQDADGWRMTRENGLKTYGAFYVPALPDEYIANMDVYDGHFN